MTKSRVVTFAREGAPEVLELHELDVPPPRAGEVRVRIEAIGLNRAEAMYRGGYYYERPARFPAICGYEAAGTIDALGDGVTGFAVGDPVSVIPSFSMRDYGVYAELANVPATAVVRRPAGQDAIAGAAVWMAGVTAWAGLVEIARLRAGDSVLVTAATGSIGFATIQVAKRLGATSIVTTRSPHKRAALLSAGATHVIVLGEEDLAARCKHLTDGRGVDLVFDALGGDGVHALGAAARPGGLLLIYGFLNTPEVAGSFGTVATPLPFTNWSLTTRWMAAQDVARDAEGRRRSRQFVLTGIASGALSPIIDRTFAFADIAAAHRYLESNAQIGKVIVTV